MEQFLEEIRKYAGQCGVKPGTVVQNAGCGGGGTWAKWEAGAGCSMHTADKLRAFMAANPVKSDGCNSGAAA